jgi:hypothetical protein
MKGVFGLDSPKDLFEKLKWEYDLLEKKPNDAYLAYNYFVTAWHLLEWIYPDPDGRAERNKIRNSEPLLQICEHLAVGAKHFEPTSKKHTSVSSSGPVNPWGKSWGGSWGSSWEGLQVSLSNELHEAYGEEIKVLELANHIFSYWNNVFKREDTST